jgi:hypothetical protein
MDIYVFGKDMTLVGMTDKMESLIWERRYWSAGEFKMLLPYTPEHAELIKQRRLIMRAGGREAAEIRYIQIRKDSNGQEVIDVQGRQITHWLDKRYVAKQINTTDNTQNILYRLVRENAADLAAAARKIPGLSVATSESLGSGTVVYTSAEGISLLDACGNAAQAAKLGFIIETDPHTGGHFFRVYKGQDRTYNNSAGNAPVIFSQDFDNVLEQEYTVSIENVKSTVYIGGEEKEGQARKVAVVGDAATGLDRDEVFLPATDITQTYRDANGNDATMTDAQYIAALTARGNEELAHYGESLAFSSKINPAGNVVIGKDYDLGDRVTCFDRRWGITIDVRITEVQETYEQQGEELQVTFGESLPTLTDKLRKVT